MVYPLAVRVVVVYGEIEHAFMNGVVAHSSMNLGERKRALNVAGLLRSQVECALNVMVETVRVVILWAIVDEDLIDGDYVVALVFQRGSIRETLGCLDEPLTDCTFRTASNAGGDHSAANGVVYLDYLVE